MGLINEIKNYKPKNFLEVGVFQGVTSRNVCEMLEKLHDKNFKYFDRVGQDEIFYNSKFFNFNR